MATDKDDDEYKDNTGDHRKFIIRVYIISTLLFLLIVTQYSMIMIFVPAVNTYLADNYIIRICATFFGFLQLLGQVTFTKRLAQSPWWFCWPYLIINLELNALPLSTVMQFTILPQFYYISSLLLFFYVFGIILNAYARKISKSTRCKNVDIGIINPIRIHICASVMSETIKALKTYYFQMTVSLIYVSTATIAHLLFSFTSGQPKYYNPERRGYLFLIMMNTLSLYVTYGSMVWCLNYIKKELI